MSWEEMSKKEVKCPCKKGVVTLTTYGDDWNRFKESASIECPDCKKKYEILEKTHHGLMASDGSWTEYFLIPKDYPKSEYSIMEIISVPKDAPFYVYLIKKYLKKDLAEILEEYRNITRVKDLRGMPSRLAKDSKERTGSAIRETIIENICMALEHYDEDPSNREITNAIDIEREAKQKEYLKERDKHLIKLDF